jgi:cysteine desulfurase/selenocysteine lyase
MDGNKGKGRPLTLAGLRNDIVGIDTRVPLLDGTERRYVFLDNAASTPTFRSVMKCVEDFMPWYSGVHRGTGFKSLVATEAFDRAHDVVAHFVGADPAKDIVIFVKNTTEGINKLAARFNFQPGDIVITTGLEHHSNDLPWRKHVAVVHVGLDEQGRLDLDALRTALRHYKGRAKLVAVSGASNITGVCSPIHEIASWTHEAGAMIFVDAAQLAPHRPIDILPAEDPRHIDFIAFSAHKIYAPFGTGALVGPVRFFEQGEPDAVGGGVASIVTLDSVVWNPPPHKDEAGSPNVVGGVALASAITILQNVGMEAIAAHERELLEYAYGKIRNIKGITLYGPTEDLADKVGVIAFNVDGMHPSHVAAVLGTEGGIGVRNGFFCAQPYVKKLLGIQAGQEKNTGCGVVQSDGFHTSGMVRASLGCYSNEEDIDILVDMLERIARRDFKGRYVQDEETGIFHAEGYSTPLEKYFTFFGAPATASPHDYSESAS